MIIIQAQIESEVSYEQALQDEADSKDFEQWNEAIKDMLDDSVEEDKNNVTP